MDNGERCSRAVSMHIPLHRLLAMFLSNVARTCTESTELLSDKDAFWKSLIPELDTKEIVACFIDAPLQLHVLLGQIQASLWIRNGLETMEGYAVAVLLCCVLFYLFIFFVKDMTDNMKLGKEHFISQHTCLQMELKQIYFHCKWVQYW